MYTVKTNTFPSQTVGITSRLEDALAMCSTVGSEAGNHVNNIRTLTSFDEFICQHNGYVCVNELYEDDEGFNKNSYMYGEMVYANGENYVKDVKDLDGLSSNSFASWSEAETVFKKKVDMIRN
jgi:hypothetical protein